MKKRVAFITSGLATGGAELVLFSLLSNIDRNLIDPIVISLRGEGDLGQKFHGIDVPLVPLELGVTPNLPLQVLKGILELRRFDPDVIQGWMYHGNIYSWLATFFMQRRPRLFFSIHNALSNWSSESRITRFLIRLNGMISNRSDCIVYASEPSALQHEARGYDCNKTQIIPNGFDCARFAPDPEDRLRIRTELGFSDVDFVIGMAARYHPVKGHDILLSAFRKTIDRFPAAKLLLCGPDVHKENLALKRLIEIHHLEQAVTLLGNRADMPRIYRAMDVLALTSISESAPGVLAEAMACEVPCVATDVGWCRTILAGTGWVTRPQNVLSISAGLIAAAELSRESLRMRGKDARNEIKSRFSLSAMIAAYQTLLISASSNASS